MSLLSSSLAANAASLTAPISISFPSSLSSASSSSSSRVMSQSSETVRALSLLNAEQHAQWINQCRAKLIKTEEMSIKSRIQHWRRVVNDKTNAINEKLNIYIAPDAFPVFDWHADASKLSLYLLFVTRWSGLKMKQIKNVPCSYDEYERKARNWLNGRRAPNYAGTLFPDLIKSAEQYAELIARHIFGANNQYSSNYQKLLIYGYLHTLCSVRISMNDVSKKTYLLCENSIKSNSATALRLQQYATDHPFAEYFPSHLKQASDYFQNKYIAEVQKFSAALRVAAGNNLSVSQTNPNMKMTMTTNANPTPNDANTNANVNTNVLGNRTSLTTMQDSGIASIPGLQSLASLSNSNLATIVTPPPSVTAAPSVTHLHAMMLSTPSQTQLQQQTSHSIANLPQISSQFESKTQMNGGLKNSLLCWPPLPPPPASQQSQQQQSDPHSMRCSHSASSSLLNFRSPSTTATSTAAAAAIMALKTPPKVALNGAHGHMHIFDVNSETTNTAISMHENVFANSKICVNGEFQTVGAFLTLLVDKCNHQHVEMQNMHQRLQLVEQVLHGHKLPKPDPTIEHTHTSNKNSHASDDDQTTNSHQTSSSSETIDDEEAAVLLSSLRHKVVTQNMKMFGDRKRSLDEVTNVSNSAEFSCKKRKI